MTQQEILLGNINIISGRILQRMGFRKTTDCYLIAASLHYEVQIIDGAWRIYFHDHKFVYSYNNNQYKLTMYPAPEGTRIEWKRNGSRGSQKAIILGYSQERPLHVFVQNWCNDWSQPLSQRANVWIKRKSVLMVLR